MEAIVCFYVLVSVSAYLFFRWMNSNRRCKIRIKRNCTFISSILWPLSLAALIVAISYFKHGMFKKLVYGSGKR